MRSRIEPCYQQMGGSYGFLRVYRVAKAIALQAERAGLEAALANYEQYL